MDCGAARWRGVAARIGVVVAVVGGWVAGPAPGFGQEPLQPELVLFEDPMVEAALKRPQAASDAPSSVTVLTREDIRRFGYRTLAEALRAVRSFYGSYDRNYEYVGVRGFLRPGDYNDRILLLVNGHTYNDDIYQTAFLGNEFGIDLEAVERIEVIRGPGSALYGGNALFAVINVVTATADQLPGVRPLVETGSFERKRGQMTVGHRFAGGLDVFASGSVLDLAGQEDLFYPEYDSPETNNGVAHDDDAERAMNVFLSARYGPFAFQGGANRREKHIPTGAFETTFDDSGTKTVDERPFAELLYAAAPRPDVALDARVFYDRYDYNGTYIYGSGAERTKNKDFATSNWVGGELRGRWEVRDRSVLIAGAEYSYHPDASQQNYDIGGDEYLNDTQSFGTWGLYAQEELEVLPTVTLVGGLRYDEFYGRVDHLSPRVAGIWSPRAETRVKLLYGQAFRAPNLYEQYYASSTEGFVNLPNPDLDPEEITTYEAVIEHGLGQRVEAVVDVFHYEVDDLIDQVEVASPDPDTVVVQFQNLTSARATGVEFGLRARLPLGVRARADYSYQDVRAAGGERLSNSPEHLVHTGVLFPLWFGFEGGADLQVIGERRTLNGNNLSPAAIANLNLNWATPVPGLRVASGFYNLFDESYADPGSADLRQDAIPQDGFTFRLQLAYAF